MALLIEVTFFNEETQEVKKKKLSVIPDHFDAYDAQKRLECIKTEVLKEEFPGFGLYDE